jgi:hypothetical protein
MDSENVENTHIVQWDIDSYMKASKALIAESNGQIINDVDLYYMDFTTPCQKIQYGPQSATLRYSERQNGLFKKIFGSYLKDWIVGINPAEQYAYVLYSEKYKSGNNNLIDIKNISSIKQILDIAENQGGRDFREKSNNNCGIFMAMGQGFNNTWYIRYSDSSNSRSFTIYVDPNSNTFRVDRNDGQ